MAFHNTLGAWGEECAARFLMKKGYTLHHQNWYYEHLEVDIIAEWFGELVFVEVKTRSNEDYKDAKDAVNLDKQENLLKAARSYMSLHQLDAPFRFDIITIVGSPEDYEIKHYRNAFTRESWMAEKKYQRETR